jgi:hypothetical protein
MIKVNKNNYKSTLEDLSRAGGMNDLISKISFKTTKETIIGFYDEFINLESDLLSKF